MMRSIFTDRAKADAMVAKYQPYISRVHPGLLTDKPGKGGVKVFDVASVARVPGIPMIAREDVLMLCSVFAGNPLTRGQILVTIDDVVLRAT